MCICVFGCSGPGAVGRPQNLWRRKSPYTTRLSAPRRRILNGVFPHQVSQHHVKDVVSGPRGQTRKNTWFLAPRGQKHIKTHGFWPPNRPGAAQAPKWLETQSKIAVLGGLLEDPPRLWKFVKKAVSAFLPIPGSAHSEWGFPTSVTTKYAPIPSSAHSE